MFRMRDGCVSATSKVVVALNFILTISASCDYVCL